MTITTKITGDQFTFAKVNSQAALDKFTEYLSHGVFVAEDAEIINIQEGEHPASYLKLSVRAFPGLDVDGHEWDKETFPVWIEIEQTNRA